MKQFLSPLGLSLLFAFCQLDCFAQDDKIFLVSLDKEKIELAYFPYKFKEIIDNRYNKITIGNVQRGMFKKRWPASFKSDMQSEVQDLFANSKLIDNKPEDYVIIINSIWINEISSYSQEKGVVNLNFNIAKKEDGSFVILSNQNITIEEEVIDATPNHDSRIAEAFKKALYNFQITPKSKYLKETLALRINHRDSLIYKTKKVSRGIFRTPQDLAYNTPDTTAVFFSNVDYIKEQSYVRDKLTKSEIQQVFAFSNGETIYLNALYYGHLSTTNAGYRFDKMPLSGAINLFQTTVKDSETSALAMAGMSLGFGLLGGVLFSAMDINKDCSFLLDLRYGTIMEFNKDNLYFLLASFPELREKFDRLNPEAQNLYNSQIQFVKRMNELIVQEEK